MSLGCLILQATLALPYLRSAEDTRTRHFVAPSLTPSSSFPRWYLPGQATSRAFAALIVYPDHSNCPGRK
jgi:hypothetical protein